MKNYIIKCILFFLPVIIAVFIEVFFLPMDYFTFRPWEALNVRRSFGILKGPFYPDMIFSKTELGGDLDSQTRCAVKKDVIFITDQYGYRKANTPLKRYPVVIVGDSNMVGPGLTQNELLSEVLEKRLSEGVYPLAPTSLKTVFEYDFIKQSPPDIVILEIIERNIIRSVKKIYVPEDNDFGKLPFWRETLLKIQLNRFAQSVAITLDRLFKANMLNYLQARIKRTVNSGKKDTGEKECPILFLQGAAANNRDISPEEINATAEKIRKCSDLFVRKGFRFIFLPIPNKENFYYKYLGTKKPVFLENLIKKLRELNVEVVDTQKAFDYAGRESTTHLYHRDDTHWNAEGVKVTADLLEDLIRKKQVHLDRK